MDLKKAAFDNAGIDLTRDTLSRVERHLKISFPEDYAAFLLECNGGIPKEDWLFDFHDGTQDRENTSVLNSFFVIYPESIAENGLPQRLPGVYNDLIFSCRIMWDEETLGKDMIPIADDPGGNVIIMCISGENRGKIYFANHEFEDEETGYLWMDEIAPSFSAFGDKLYPENE